MPLYSVRHSIPVNASYIAVSPDGEYFLSRKHDYFYQQLGITNRSYCDFVCWTPQAIFTEIITYDTKFFEEIEAKLQQFFVYVILPSVLCGEKKKAHPSEATGIFCRTLS